MGTTITTITTTEQTEQHTSTSEQSNGTPQPLPLENGDRLTRDEFEHRYHAMPHLKKAELIEGVVYVPSPAHYAAHAKPHSQVNCWLGVYAASTPGTAACDNVTLHLDKANEVQPDALLRIEAANGGTSSVSYDDYLEGAPELIVEIAASSASYDMHVKRDIYCRCGVQEYLVWRVYDRRLDWWLLRGGVYTPLAPDDNGISASHTFPGLRLHVAALLRDDMSTVLHTLQQGLNTPAHTAFVERLQAQG
jgi:Uma2 family endonuclease